MNIGLLREAFPSSEVGTREASATLATSTAATRILRNELRTKGLLLRTGRGRYRIAPEPDQAKLDRRRMQLRLERALDAPVHLGLDGPDAISIWTGGRCTVCSQSGTIAAPDEAD